MLQRLRRRLRRYTALPTRIYKIQEALGRIEARQLEESGSRAGVQNAEFRVFSQWGEDGIIQYLVSRVPLVRKVFVEFGVEDYQEANTRFLLSNNHWSGLIMDGSAEHIANIKADPIYWACNLKAEHAFITAENIDALLQRNGIAGDIGLLSIDVDGNDYWIWKAINAISPRIVICEYNSHFGPSAAVSVPYDASFVRDSAHYSKIYYGASISALTELARQKGYALVASNEAGNNVFFVRHDIVGELPILTPQEAYRPSSFRESHDQSGRLTFGDFESRVALIAEMPIHNVRSDRIVPLREALATQIGI
jgi:hypothetical protein